MTWWLWVQDPVEANFFSSIVSSLTIAEVCEKSSRRLWEESCVKAGVRKPGNTCASLTAMIWPKLLSGIKSQYNQATNILYPQCFQNLSFSKLLKELLAFSPFPTMFSEPFFLTIVKTCDCVVKGFLIYSGVTYNLPLHYKTLFSHLKV